MAMYGTASTTQILPRNERPTAVSSPDLRNPCKLTIQAHREEEPLGLARSLRPPPLHSSRHRSRGLPSGISSHQLPSRSRLNSQLLEGERVMLGVDDDSPRSRQTHARKPSRVLLPDRIRHSHAQPAALRYSPTSHLGREKHGVGSTTSIRRKKGTGPRELPRR